MPAPDGTLTEAEVSIAQTTLLAFWEKVGGRPPCRSCGTDSYYIMPHLVGNRSDTLSPMEAHHRYPAVVVMCQQCGLFDQYLCRNLGISWLEVPQAGVETNG